MGSFDVVILGSGLASATLATILARHGVRVVMIEAGSHPRFAIGESVVPEFGALANLLAGRFDVPELGHLANFQRLRHHVSANCGIKRNFSFLHHKDGTEPVDGDWCQFRTMTHPLGPDSHIYRPDIDAWLTVLAVKYGAEYRERSPVLDPDADVELGDDCVTVRAGGRTVTGRFLVDGTGFRSVIARKLGLREESTASTDSRTLFTHMVGVRSLESVLPNGGRKPVPSPPDQGTLHHLFDGGWFWVIPFNNHSLAVNGVCSVGLTLDRKKYPDSDQDAEEEFFEFARRFPTIRRQLDGAKAVRSWVKTGRLQYQSSKATGPRWCLLPHSVAFLDPLFSGGMVFSLLGVRKIAAALLEALPRDDPSPIALEDYERTLQADVAAFDKVIHGAYIAFRSVRLFNAWFRYWAIGSYHGSAGTIALHMRFLSEGQPEVYDALDRVPYRQSLGTDDPRVGGLIDEGYQILRAVDAGDLAPAVAEDQLFELLSRQSDWIPPQFHIAERDRRHLASFTVFPLLAMIAWGKRNAPKEMRDVYYDVGPIFFYELTKSLFLEGWRGLLSFLNVVKAAHVSSGRV